jgi:hypothetical protein
MEKSGVFRPGPKHSPGLKALSGLCFSQYLRSILGVPVRRLWK